MRYYDPVCGRFVSQDPIGLLGGEHLYMFSPNALIWLDPLGWRKYIVYQARDLDTGKIYTGQTSGKDSLSAEQILKKRFSSHHRNLESLQLVYETNSYKAARGGEHYFLQEERRKGTATKQINAIADRNFAKKGCADKKGDIYMK